MSCESVPDGDGVIQHFFAGADNQNFDHTVTGEFPVRHTDVDGVTSCVQISHCDQSAVKSMYVKQVAVWRHDAEDILVIRVSVVGFHLSDNTARETVHAGSE